MTKASELRELTDDVLEQRLAEAKDELFKLRFGHATGQLDKYHRLHESSGATSRASARCCREREIATRTRRRREES